MSKGKWNCQSASVKRILQELTDLQQSPEESFEAHPLEDDIFEWHFTIRGTKDTDYEGGFYHGRLLLPLDYPFQPPSYMMLSESGRFAVGTKICLSNSDFHPDLWGAGWDIRTALIAMVAYMPHDDPSAIGAVCYPTEKRKKIASESGNFCCPICKKKNSEWFSEQQKSEGETTQEEVVTNSCQETVIDDSIKLESEEESTMRKRETVENIEEKSTIEEEKLKAIEEDKAKAIEEDKAKAIEEDKPKAIESKSSSMFSLLRVLVVLWLVLVVCRIWIM